MSYRVINGLFIGLLAISFLLGACQQTAPTPPIEELTISPTETNTQTTSATSTISPTTMITFTPEPSLTPSPTPTSTTQWDQRSLMLTPIPELDQKISSENANQVGLMAVWGNGKASTIALSPDARLLAVGTGIGVFLYDSLNFRFITTLVTPDAVQSIAFSPDSQSIALGQSNGIIDIFEINNESLIARLTIPTVDFAEPREVSVLFSQNGAALTSLTQTDNTIYINRWETSAWQPEEDISIGRGLVSFINPTSDLVGVIDGDTLQLQSLTLSDESTMISLPSSEPDTFWDRIPVYDGEIVPSTDGEFIFINNGSTILQWELSEEEITYRLNQYPDELPDPCYAVPNTCRDRTGNFAWECEQDQRIPPIETIALTPNNANLLVSINQNRSELRRTSDGFRLWEIDANFTDLAFSPNAEFFFGLKPDGTIEKRSIIDGELEYSLNQHPSRLHDIAFSPDGSVIAIGYSDSWIRVYSVLNGEMLGVLDGHATAIQFSPDGRLLGAGLEDGTVRVFELNEGRYYDLPGGHLAEVTDLAFSWDGGAILTGSKDCTISLWDLGGRYRRRNLTPGQATPFQIRAVDLSFINQNQYVLGMSDGVFRVDETEITVLFAPRNIGFKAMALSPNARQVAITGPTTWLIPALAVDPLTNLRELSFSSLESADTLAFSPNEDILCAAALQGLEFWSLNQGDHLAFKPFTPQPQKGNQPLAMDFSPNGTLIAIGKEDGLIYIFAVIE